MFSSISGSNSKEKDLPTLKINKKPNLQKQEDYVVVFADLGRGEIPTLVKSYDEESWCVSAKNPVTGTVATNPNRTEFHAYRDKQDFFNTKSHLLAEIYVPKDAVRNDEFEKKRVIVKYKDNEKYRIVCVNQFGHISGKDTITFPSITQDQAAELHKKVTAFDKLKFQIISALDKAITTLENDTKSSFCTFREREVLKMDFLRELKNKITAEYKFELENDGIKIPKSLAALEAEVLEGYRFSDQKNEISKGFFVNVKNILDPLKKTEAEVLERVDVEKTENETNDNYTSMELS